MLHAEQQAAMPHKGIRVEMDEPGTGDPAARGDTVTIRYTLSLNRGDVIRADVAATFTLGQRRMIAGLEYGVEGMRVGGRRRFRASPHLCYRDAGIAGVVPANAVLIFDVRLLAVQNQRNS